MIPSPSAALQFTPSTKPKLGFSIDSIVGGPRLGGVDQRGSPPPSPGSPRGSPRPRSPRSPLGNSSPEHPKPLVRVPEPIHPLGIPGNLPPHVGLPSAVAPLPGLPGLHVPHALNLAALLPGHVGAGLPGLPGAGGVHPGVLLGQMERMSQLGQMTQLGAAAAAAGQLGTPLPPAHGPREFPLYPWLLSRHAGVGRLFAHRFPGT